MREITFLCWFLLLLVYLTMTATAPTSCTHESSSVDVQLCSSLQDLSQLCPGQPLTFTCTTVGSQFLAWSSPHYVSESGSALFFSESVDIVGTTRPSRNGASIGNLTKVNSSGPIILESQLHFNVSDQYSTSQIICINTANGMNATATFIVDLERTSAECHPPTTATMILNSTTSQTTGQPLTMWQLILVLLIVLGSLVIGALFIICCCCCVPHCPCYYKKICQKQMNLNKVDYLTQ